MNQTYPVKVLLASEILELSSDFTRFTQNTHLPSSSPLVDGREVRKVGLVHLIFYKVSGL